MAVLLRSLFRPHHPRPRDRLWSSDDLYLIGHENDFSCTAGRKSRFAILAPPPPHLARALAIAPAARPDRPQLDCTLRYAGEIDRSRRLKLLVYRGRGYTILPKIALGNEGRCQLRLLRLVEPSCASAAAGAVAASATRRARR